MKLFLDTNILIDVVTNRKPWVDAALVLFELASQKKVTLIAADYSFINIAYITRKLFEKEELYTVLNDLREYVQIVELGEKIIDDTINAQWNDMEDCTQYMAALRENADYIITRNEKDFILSKIPALSAEQFLSRYL